VNTRDVSSLRRRIMDLIVICQMLLIFGAMMMGWAWGRMSRNKEVQSIWLLVDTYKLAAQTWKDEVEELSKKVKEDGDGEG
jgi:hypothetical protein